MAWIVLNVLSIRIRHSSHNLKLGVLTMLNKKTSPLKPTINRVISALMLTITSGVIMTDAQATQQYMDYYKAPACTSCHTSGVFNSRTGKAGLASYLALSPSACTASKVLQNNSCVTPTVAANDSDRIFAYLEAAYPEHFSPADSVSASIDGYYYRYYSATKSYIATINKKVYYLGPASQNKMISLGAMSDWLPAATPTPSSDDSGDDNDHDRNDNKDHDD